MFTRALEIANGFTFPYVGLRRRRDGGVFSIVGAFVAVNADGWILTSGHIVDEILSREEERGVAEESVPDAERACLVSNRTEIWALPGFMQTHPQLVEAHVNRLADIALCRIAPFDASAIAAFPHFRDTTAEPIDQGMSVCRLGFPFYDVEATFNEAADEFALGPNAFPVPRFALDGIVARFHRRVGEDGETSAIYIETSTPGLRGQSGGPLLDIEGRVCGLQSHTTHLDLGFDARYDNGGESVVERQFLNVGAASHVDEIVALLGESGITRTLG